MKRKSGFTLIEVLVALTLFTFGMVTVMQLLPLNKRYIKQSAMVTQATFLAQEKLELVRSVSYASLSVGTDPYYEPTTAMGISSTDPLREFSRQTEVSYVDPANSFTNSSTDTGIKKVIVRVSWNERSIPRTYSLSTFVYDR